MNTPTGVRGSGDRAWADEAGLLEEIVRSALLSGGDDCVATGGTNVVDDERPLSGAACVRLARYNNTPRTMAMAMRTSTATIAITAEVEPPSSGVASWPITLT